MPKANACSFGATLAADDQFVDLFAVIQLTNGAENFLFAKLQLGSQRLIGHGDHKDMVVLDAYRVATSGQFAKNRSPILHE